MGSLLLLTHHPWIVYLVLYTCMCILRTSENTNLTYKTKCWISRWFLINTVFKYFIIYLQAILILLYMVYICCVDVCASIIIIVSKGCCAVGSVAAGGTAGRLQKDSRVGVMATFGLRIFHLCICIVYIWHAICLIVFAFVDWHLLM